MDFEDHLWLPFLDQPQSDIVAFAIITFQVHNILLTEWKHIMGPNNIITFNEELEFLSASIIELVNIGECYHKTAIIIFITKIIKENKKLLQKITMEIYLNFPFPKKVYIPSPFLLKVNSNQKSFRNPLDKLAARPIALNTPHRAPLHTGARWDRVGGALSRVILDHPALVLLVILGGP